MPGIQISSPKAPWIMFERRAEEDRQASIDAGRYVGKDVDFVLITPHGSKDQIERIVSEWFEHLKQQVAEERFEEDWRRQYMRAYDLWKEGKEMPLEGTPIINWPVASPAQIRMLQDLHILTVEVLAACNEETMRRLGMGGRTLVDKAKAFISASNGPGKLAEQMADLAVRVKAAESINAALLEQNASLRAQMAAGPAPVAHLDVTQAPTPLPTSISASDLLADEPTGFTKL